MRNREAASKREVNKGRVRTDKKRDENTNKKIQFKEKEEFSTLFTVHMLNKHKSSQYFLDLSAKAKEIKEKLNKWDLIKLKSFCTTKETISKMKRQPTEWEEIFSNDTIG